MIFVISRTWTNSMTGEKQRETVHYGWKGRTARSALINFLAECEGIEAKNVEKSNLFGIGYAVCDDGFSRYVATETHDHSL